MRIFRPSIAIAGALALAFVTTTRAHEGHGHVAAVEYDLTLPRRPSPEARKHIGIDVAPATIRPLEDVVRLSGVVKVDPERRFTASARHAGLVVLAAKRVGDVVRAGDILARVDSPERARAIYDLRKLEVEIEETRLEIETARGDVESADATIAAAKRRIETARRAYDRAVELERQGTVTLADLEERGSALAEFESQLVGADVSRATAERRADASSRKLAAIEVSRDALASMLNLGATPDPKAPPTGEFDVVAARDGVVMRADAVVGAWVPAGAPLFQVADLSVVLVEGRLPERELARLAIVPGAPARLWLDRFPSVEPLAAGVVRFVGAEIDPVSRTATIGVEVANVDLRLRAEQYVELAVVTGVRPKSLAIPREALIEMGSLAFVFVESGEEFLKQDVAIGGEDDRFVEVLSGLAPNDRVVVRGGFALTQLRPDGAAVPAAAEDDHGHDH